MTEQSMIEQKNLHRDPRHSLELTNKLDEITDRLELIVAQLEVLAADMRGEKSA